ncbi:MAG: 2-iminobutanoate/2-iminopropanoate deaminase [Chloroflexota bacterium]|jgi:enamine deaminase RidA (YjgF/YER057c/UK114 family)|nr:2-iminobutanoate/2-iminopropanoate deaminase [Chloroflexota bacterium]
MTQRRTVIKVPGLSHRTPISLGAKVGNIVHSAPIYGTDVERQLLPADPAEQAAHMFKNVRLFMDAAGGTIDDIVHIQLFLKDFKYRDAVDVEWLKMFPDEENRPSRHAVSEPEIRGGGAIFGVEILAVVD